MMFITACRVGPTDHLQATARHMDVQRGSKRMTRFHIITFHNKNVLQLQNKLQIIK